MKHTNHLLLVGLIGLASGCAFNRHVVLQTAVGPPRPVREISSLEGWLRVYSGFDIAGGGVDSDYSHHSDYKIYSPDGKLLKNVSNKVSAIMEDRATVSLPPGKYKVVAKAAVFATATLSVVIEAGKTTSVHLDGSEPTGGIQTSTNDFVRLPDGLIIGWRAKNETKPK